MAKGFPSFATLTEPPLPSASVAWLALDLCQGGPGNVTESPVRLVQNHARIGLLYLTERQLRPRQTDRRHSQAGEKLGWRNLLWGNPHGLGDVTLRHTKRCMHQRRRIDLHGHAIRTGGGEAMQIQDLFEVFDRSRTQRQLWRPWRRHSPAIPRDVKAAKKAPTPYKRSPTSKVPGGTCSRAAVARGSSAAAASG